VSPDTYRPVRGSPSTPPGIASGSPTSSCKMRSGLLMVASLERQGRLGGPGLLAAGHLATSGALHAIRGVCLSCIQGPESVFFRGGPAPRR